MSTKYGGGAKCPRCEKTVYFNEEVLAAGKKWHKACFKCFQCNKPLDSMQMADMGGKLYCKECHKKNFANFDMVPQVSPAQLEGGGGPKFGGSERCGRCGKPVYLAEKALAGGRSWHKGCFSCATCHKKLDSTTVCDQDGQIYCKPCHTKNFGLKGYGYGQGAGVLSMQGKVEARPPNMPASASGVSSGGTSKFGGSAGCGRCGKAVYAAEKVVGAGKTWHKACFSCTDCKKKLDSTTVCDKDGAIFCKGCYGGNFGPKGYGYGGGAGALTRTN